MTQRIRQIFTATLRMFATFIAMELCIEFAAMHFFNFSVKDILLQE